MTTPSEVDIIVAAIAKIDYHMQQAAAVRAVRDDAVRRALAEGVRPAVIRRVTGLSISMIRVIRDQDRRRPNPQPDVHLV